MATTTRTTIRTYATEFGLEYAPPQQIIDLLANGTLKDVSWCNDACPSFSNADGTLVLYVSPEDRKMREIPEMARFGLQDMRIEDGTGEASWIHNGESLNVALSLMLGADVLGYEIPEALAIMARKDEVEMTRGPFCLEFSNQLGRTLFLDYVDPAKRQVPSRERYSVMDESGQVGYTGDSLENALVDLKGETDAEHVTLTAHTAVMDAFGIGNDKNDSFLLAIPLDSHVGEEIQKAIARVIALEFDSHSTVTKALG